MVHREMRDVLGAEPRDIGDDGGTNGGSRPESSGRTEGGWAWLHNVPVPPAHVVAICAGLLAERRHPLHLTWRDPPRRVVGLAFTAMGAALAVRSVAEATAVRLDDPARLIITGPYAMSRNPMYLAWHLVHVGVGLLARSGWTLALLPPAAALLDREIRAEERMLGDRFGRSYARYRTSVPRYFLACHRLVSTSPVGPGRAPGSVVGQAPLSGSGGPARRCPRRCRPSERRRRAGW